jgi:phage recombination protein Bet
MAMQVVVGQQFNPDQLATIKATVAKGTTDEEFKLFIEVCRYHALNPFARQIYAVVRPSKDGTRNLCIQTSIDGYRLLAERSGKYAGQTGPQWCGKDGEWKDVWLSDEPPAAARIGIFRKDFSQPIWGVAKYKSYAQGTPIWAKMPDTMLAKCAESLALRKAFPAEMSGIYTREEMEQAADDDLPTVDHQVITVESTPSVEGNSREEDLPISEQQLASIRKLREQLGKPEPEGIARLTFFGARKVIQQLTTEYKEACQKKSEEQAKAISPLNALYDRAKALNQFAHGQNKHANVTAFLAWCSRILHVTVRAQSDLTDGYIRALNSHLDTISKPAVVGQAVS